MSETGSSSAGSGAGGAGSGAGMGAGSGAGMGAGMGAMGAGMGAGMGAMGAGGAGGSTISTSESELTTSGSSAVPAPPRRRLVLIVLMLYKKFHVCENVIVQRRNMTDATAERSSANAAAQRRVQSFYNFRGPDSQDIETPRCPFSRRAVLP